MGIEDVDFSTDTLTEGTEQEKNTQSADTDKSGYPILKEGDAEFVKMPKGDFENFRQQSMKASEFDKSIAEIQVLRDNLQAQVKTLESQLNQPGQSKEEKKEKLSEIDALRQEIAQLKNGYNDTKSELLTAKIDKEIASFKEAHKDIFTGNEKDDATLMDLICGVTAMAANASKRDDYPIQEAYDNFMKPLVEDAYRYRALQKKKQASMETEGNATSRAAGLPKPPQDDMDASINFAKAFEKLQGRGES